ncbi:MAG: hypothetical protein KatS3mg027_2557 [Bacteroidia bacterium]|nr:MAG: hypothetical protein KatS3mg027_2557 [Bacteroidia bacterium]
MMWLWLVVIAYILNAVATLISKRLLITSIPHPVVFVFYIGGIKPVGFDTYSFWFFYT